MAAAALLERVLPRTLVRAVALWAALGGRSLAREAQAVADLVERGEIDAARTRIRSLVGRDPQQLDGTGLCKAAIESVAENTVDAVIAPLFWAAVAGAPGVLGHRAVNTLDAMVGKRNERYARFGTASARADDVANWPAARLARRCCVRATAARRWRRGREAPHPSPNAGVIEAAFAGALGVALGGTLAYAGRVEHRPQLGRRRAPGPGDVARAIRLARRISLATAVLAALVSRPMKGAILDRRHDVRRRQERRDRRAVPLAQAPGRQRRAVQGAEHVAQLDGHAAAAPRSGGRRRCRPRRAGSSPRRR